MTSKSQTNLNFRRDTLIPAHFNKKELLHLDRYMPNGREYSKGTRIPNYKKLGAMFDDQNVNNVLDTHMREQKANGGGVHLEKAKKHGRYGDTEVALIPKHVADRFNKYLGGGTVNPHTGYPEYFLGSLLGGLAKAGMGAMKAAAPAMASMGKAGMGAMRTAMPAIGNAVKSAAPGIGSALKTGMTQVGLPLATQFLANKMTPQQQDGGAQQQQGGWGQSGADSALNGLMSMMQARQSGQSWGDAAKAGLGSGAMNFAKSNPLTQQVMSRFGGGEEGGEPSPWGQLAGNAFNSFMDSRNNGGSFQDSLRKTALDTAYGAANQFNNPYAKTLKGAMEGYQNGGMEGAMLGGASGALQGRQDPYSQVAQSMIGARQRGGGLEDMAMSGGNQFLQGRTDPYSQTAQSMMQARQRGGGMQDMMLAGGDKALSQMNNPYASIGRDMINTRQRGGGLQDMAMSGANRALQGRQDPYSRTAQSMLNSRQNGGGMEDMMLAGGNQFLQGRNDPYSSMGRDMIQNRQNGQSYGQAAGNTAMNTMSKYLPPRAPTGHIPRYPAQSQMMDQYDDSEMPMMA